MCVTLSRERRQRKREGEGSKGLNRFEKLDDEKDEQSMASFFLCYECGTTFSVRNDFDEHILVHQAVSLCYQIYEFDKGGPSVVKAKLENQHTSFKESYKPQAVKLLTTFRKTSDCSQKNVRKITTTKRKLMGLSFSPDSPSKVPCLKQKKNSQNDIKITKGNKTQDNSAVIATVGSQLIHLQVDREHSKMGLDVTLSADVSGATHTDLMEDQVTSPLKLAELPKTDMTVATSTKSSGVIIPSSPSTSTTSASAPALPKCLNCDYRSSQGTDMVEHGIFIFFLTEDCSLA
uniref:Zinc finger, C2H2 type family protein n=1 Tax=Brugia malayi TaxID=6279 RepID=A8Q6R2_BRUMA